MQETAWKWITSHQEIWVGREREGNHLTLTEAEALEPEDLPASIPLEAIQYPFDRSRSRIQEPPPEIASSGLRLYTTQGRSWKAITGHGVDWKKVSQLEFQLLSFIATAGSQGMIQPDLIGLTGQDKRSIPKRTNVLHEKGYIVKKPILTRGYRTSHLLHRNYVDKSQGGQILDGANLQLRFENGRLDYAHFVDVLTTLLRAAKNNILAIEDLRKQLDVNGKPWMTKALWRGIERLAIVTVADRVKAKSSDGRWTSA